MLSVYTRLVKHTRENSFVTILTISCTFNNEGDELKTYCFTYCYFAYNLRIYV